MANAMATLVAKLTTDNKQFNRGLQGATGALRSFAGTATKLMAPLTGLLGGALGGAAAGFGVKLAADAETMATSFGVLLGSVEQAHKVLADLTDFAASTPFEQPELNDAARSLLAFGVSADELIPTLRSVGDIASGIGAPIGDIAEIFGKARVQGRLAMEDINQLTGRGVPIIQELASQFGVAESKVRKLVETGKVNFGNLQTAFQNLTKDGGKFGGMMDKQSQTLNGLWSTMMDNVKITLTEIGKVIIDEFNLKPLLTDSIAFAQAIQGKILPAMRSGIQTLKSFGQTLYDVFTSDTAKTIGKFVAIAGGASAAIVGIVTVATTAGPALAAAFTLATGPIGLATVAVVGLGAAIVQATGEGETFGEKISSTFGQLPDVVDGLGFTFRNFGSVAKIALIDVVLTGLEYFPQLEAPIENVAAFFVGVWSGVQSFFGAFVQNVIAGFQEIANFGKAIAAGVTAAFEAISAGDFSGAAGAFGDAFVKELASQQDVQGGGNPFEAFGESFKEAQKETLATFRQGGGLGNLLQTEKDRLLDEIGQEELQRTQAQQAAAKALAPETGLPTGESPLEQKPQVESKGDVGGVGAVDARSTAAFSAIQAAIRGGQKDPTQEKIAKSSEKTAKGIAKIEQNTRELVIPAEASI